MKRIQIQATSERGQSMIEMAVAFVVLLILIAGVTDLGRAFFTYMALRDAAQEGAAYGSMNPTDTVGIVERVRHSSSDPVDLMSADVSVGVTVVGSACSGNGIRVTVSYDDFPMIMPFFATFMGVNSIDLSAFVVDEILTPKCP